MCEIELVLSTRCYRTEITLGHYEPRQLAIHFAVIVLNQSRSGFGRRALFAANAFVSRATFESDLDLIDIGTFSANQTSPKLSGHIRSLPLR